VERFSFALVPHSPVQYVNIVSQPDRKNADLERVVPKSGNPIALLPIRFSANMLVKSPARQPAKHRVRRGTNHARFVKLDARLAARPAANRLVRQAARCPVRLDVKWAASRLAN